MVNHLFSTCMIHSRKLHFTFLLYFFKAYLPFLARYRDANKQNAACNLHRLPKIQFQFYIEEETSPQPFYILRSDWDMSRLWFVNLKNSEKSVGIVEIGPCGTEIPQSGCCDGCQVSKKGCKRLTRCR